MLDDSFDGSIILDHLLVVAAALLVGTRPQELAHDAVEVPLATLLLLSLYHLSKFHQEVDVFSILLVSPVRSGVLLLYWRAVIQTINHLLGPEHPGLKFTQLLVDCGHVGNTLGALLEVLLAAITHLGL
jgi:hypothetical protein